MTATVMLNIGSGEYPLDGFENYDIQDFDIRDDWPLARNYADYIHMSHVLEHVTRVDAINVLLSAKKVLKSGGVLHLAVPDMDKFVDCRINNDWSPLEGYAWTDFNHFLGGDGSEPRDHYRHKYMWTFGALYYYLSNILGYHNVQRTNANEYDNPKYHAISLYVEAMK